MASSGNLEGKETYRILLSEEVTFLNKGSILQTINRVPAGSRVVIDGSKSKVIDHDVIEVIKHFTVNAVSRNVDVEVVNLPDITPQPADGQPKVEETKFKHASKA